MQGDRIEDGGGVAKPSRWRAAAEKSKLYALRQPARCENSARKASTKVLVGGLARTWLLKSQ
jgi:hypothetical protein